VGYGYASIDVIAPPIISKQFWESPILTGNSTTLTFTIINPNTFAPLTGIGFTDTLPAGITPSSPTVGTGWSANPTLSLLGQTLTVSNGELAASGTGTINITITGSTAGSYTNTTGNVFSTEGGTGNTASDTLHVVAPSPSISILKQVGLSNSGPWYSFLAVTLPVNIYYQFIVENTGDVPLTNIIVKDPPGGTTVCSWTDLPVADVNDDDHIVTCVVGPITAVSGYNANTAEVTALYNGSPIDPDSDSAAYATAAVSIAKSADKTYYSIAGETITYTYTVTNSGFATLDGPVTVTDDIAEGETCQPLTAIGDNDNYFDPGESVTCTATYVVQAGDVGAGKSIINTASATVDGISSNTDSVTVDWQEGIDEAGLAVSKTCMPISVGQTGLAYIIVVQNNGPAEAVGVVLEDVLPGFLTPTEYSVDNGPLIAWPGDWVSDQLPLGDMAMDDVRIIQIYGTVTGPAEPNTASVSSGTPDPDMLNNSSTCTEGTPFVKRRALGFPQIKYCGGCNPGITDLDDAFVTVTDDDDGNVDDTLDLTDTGTIEAWIYPQTAFVEDAGVVFKGDANGVCYGFGFGGGSTVFTQGSNQNIVFVIGNTGGANYQLYAPRELQLDKWYHITCVWNRTTSPYMAIYINGILEASNTTTGPLLNVRINDDDLMFGIQNVTPAKFPGIIDEVRLWNTARPIVTAGPGNDIRDFMCKKLTGSELGLVGYWRFDEQGGSTCFDSTINGNVGILNAEVNRVCSEAPVGDDSAWDYGDYPSPLDDFIQSLSSSFGDEITISPDSGVWSVALKSGLQVYRVDDPPSPASAPIGWKSLASAPHYFGVFVTGGTGPKYKMEYNYSGYPGIANENALQVAYRRNNCDTWKNLNAKKSGTVFKKTGLSGTEFILGEGVDPRNAILYAGDDDYVEVLDDDNTLDLPNAGTLEAWINISDFHDNMGIIHKGNGTSDSYSIYMGSGPSYDVVYFNVFNGTPIDSFASSSVRLDPDTWYHIAGVWDTTTMILYINGVEVASGTSVSANPSTASLYIGVNQNGPSPPNCFDGYIDEVRVWDIARDQDDIRATMCRKLNSTVDDFMDLMGYWRFDEETDNPICPDSSGKNNYGTMMTSPGFSNNTVPAGFNFIREYRVCSSAPIGDDSAYDYFDLGAGVSVQLNHPDGDYMFGTEDTGNWADTFSGLHLYVLNEYPVYPPDLWLTPPPDYGYLTPNGLTPPSVWSSIDYYRYWGVFVTDWVNNPTYEIEYHYTGNPSVPVDDSVIGLAKRPYYCYGTWTDTGATPSGGILTVSGETGTEYVLGGKDAPLAITLASFTAKVVDGCIQIFWETATEIGTLGFELWRCTEKDGEYELVPGSYTRSEAVIETQGVQYSFTDCDTILDGNTTYYYKLEEIDLDNAKDNPLYGPIGPVPDAVTASQPSTAKDSRDKVCFISILMD
jgi:uncharacterized repeat protein (TIGR01451 family)